jgi:hypothetical protein
MTLVVFTAFAFIVFGQAPSETTALVISSSLARSTSPLRPRRKHAASQLNRRLHTKFNSTICFYFQILSERPREKLQQLE